jgi:signal transduction histidine kinase
MLSECSVVLVVGVRFKPLKSGTIHPLSACGAAVFLLFVISGVATAEPKRASMLHSFGRDFTPWNEFAKNFRDELHRQSPEPVDIYEESLATARFTAEGEEAELANYLGVLSANHRLDLVVSIGAPAARFFQRFRAQLFPSTVMMLTAVQQRLTSVSDLTAHDAVVANSTDLADVVENILRVLPETRNVAVVLGNSPLEKYWLEQLRIAFEPFTNLVEFWLNEMSFDDILKTAATLPPRSAIYFALMSVDAAGVPYEQDKALSALHAVPNAPIFSQVDAHFGSGIVGGPLMSVQETSRQAASVAVRILAGEAAGDTKTPPIGFGAPKFDWREMQRWGINEDRLPPGSEVQFRPPTMWDQYRLQVSVAFSLLLFQGTMIAGLLFERGRRRRAEIVARDRLREVIHLNRTAAVAALSASVSHELEQPLGAILHNAEAAKLLLAANPPDLGEVQEIITDILGANQRAVDIIQHLRRLLKRTGQNEAQKFDLNTVIADALKILSPEAAKRGILLRATGIARPLPVRADRVQLEQVIVNLVANGIDAMGNPSRGAGEITIETALNGASEVRVSVIDSGTGIPKDKLEEVFEAFYTTKQQGNGIGLSIARTIVETYGGRIWAENQPGGGAVFHILLPLAATP